MTFDRVKLFLLCLCATVLVGVSAYANVDVKKSNVHIGVFNSKQGAQDFYEALPKTIKGTIDRDQLWLDVYKSNKGFLEHHINISNLSLVDAKVLCDAVSARSVQCITSGAEPLFAPAGGDQKEEDAVLSVPPTAIAAADAPKLPHILTPLGVQLNTVSDHEIEELDLALAAPQLPFTYQENLQVYGDAFTLETQPSDTKEAQAAKAAYDVARSKFLVALQNIDDSADEAQAAQENLIALGREAFEAAGSAYLSGFLEKEIGAAKVLSDDAGSGEAFVHHVQKNLSSNAEATVSNLIDEIVSNAASGQIIDGHAITEATDALVLSGARSVIDAGLSAARRSDLYALRHLELEYTLNDFENSYFSVLTTQPVYQSGDLRHNVFLQGGGIINEQSVDIDDDVARHTLNIGAAYRYLTVDEQYLLGGNVFFDHQWPYNHSRLGFGVDAKAENLNLAANYYHPLSDFRDSRIDENGTQFEERALRGYDLELGYQVPFLPDLSVFGKGYQYFRDADDDLRGLELSAEYNIRDNFTVTGALIEENGGRDGFELALQYSVPLYSVDTPNLVSSDLEPVAGSGSQKSRIFEKVRRENRIRVEERAVIDDNVVTDVTAQFNALSIGLPFDVGGAATGSGVNLPFDTAITVPNGDFGIINFSNGAIANLSASGGGDVIVEFNNSIFTVTATNGGFVQFISASGGISTVNVPGGTVNLLGTDIDVTDDGTTTTIQTRAGQIQVVPDVGAAALNGNQADIVSLTIASGATSLLIDPALETRQEAAFTSLDLINPDPPGIETSAPFINALPELITGPQFVGNNADLRLTFTQPVTVSGAPFVNGLVGVNARAFAFEAAASSPTQLVFRHVYIADDVGAASITINDLDLNGGTIISTANTLNAITAFTDTIVPINDLTTPSLVNSIPVDGDPAFSPIDNIVLNFDENIQAGIGNIFLTDTTDGSDNRIISIGDPQISIVGSTLTFNPTTSLELLTDYEIVIASGVVEDVSGNDFTGIASGELNFTTPNGTTPLFVSVTPPADGVFVSGQNLDWTITYDQAVTVSGGIPTIDLTLDTGVVTASFAGGSGTANLLFRHTITSADLDTDGVVLSNIITPAGATLVDTISLSQNAATDFTAVNVATPAVLIDQAPTLLSSTPIDNATGESVGIDATLTFSENIQAGTGNIVFTDTDDGSGDFTIPVGDARVTFTANVVSIDLSAQLLEFNTNYEITMAAGVIEDTGVVNIAFAGLASGDLSWQTIVNPIAGFPAPTVSMAPGTLANSHEDAQDIGTWQTTIDIGAAPDGIIFESGASGQGIAAVFNAGNLVFAAGAGTTTATSVSSIFGTHPIASIPQGLHHFVFVADPDAPAEIGVYIDGIRVITESITGGMQGGEWAGTNGAGYGIINNAIRSGVTSSPITGATLSNNLSFYTNIAPADF